MKDPNDSCILCGLLWEEHIVRDMRTHWKETHPAVTAFSENEEMTFTNDPMGEQMCGHFDVAAAVLPLSEANQKMLGSPSHLPVLIFMFAGDTPVTRYVVLDDTAMRAVPALVSSAVQSALKQSRKRR